MQLSFLEESVDVRADRKVDKCLESQDKLRKKLFAENNSMKKEIRELKNEVEFLKSHICKTNMFSDLPLFANLHRN